MTSEITFSDLKHEAYASVFTEEISVEITCRRISLK